MPRPRRIWKDIKGAAVARLGGMALRGLARVAGWFSQGQAGRLGSALGRLIFIFTPHRRGIAWRNLTFAFPDRSEEELRRILRRCYENLGLCLVEFLRLPAVGRNRGIHELVALEGEEHLRRAVAKGRGVILLTAHYGNWELVGAKLAASGFPLNVLAREQRDGSTTSLVNGIREQAGMRVLGTRDNETSRVLGCLRRGEIVGFLVDQNAGRDGMFVDFFGRLASTHAGAAFFALRAGAAVVPVFGLRGAGNTHIARLLPEVEIIRSGNLREDMKTNTAAFTHLLEEQIRACPEMWFWLHDRWKARPPQEKRGPRQAGNESV